MIKGCGSITWAAWSTFLLLASSRKSLTCTSASVIIYFLALTNHSRVLASNCRFWKSAHTVHICDNYNHFLSIGKHFVLNVLEVKTLSSSLYSNGRLQIRTKLISLTAFHTNLHCVLNITMFGRQHFELVCLFDVPRWKVGVGHTTNGSLRQLKWIEHYVAGPKCKV